MFTLTDAERFALFTAIDNGTAQPVPAARVNHDEQTNTFYRLDGRVFMVEYNHRTTESVCREVTGADLELFDIFYGEG